MQGAILSTQESNLGLIFSSIHLRLEELMEREVSLNPDEAKISVKEKEVVIARMAQQPFKEAISSLPDKINLFDCYQLFKLGYRSDMGLAEILVDLADGFPSIDLDDISGFYSNIDTYINDREYNITLSVDEHVTLAKYIWSKRSENFRELYAVPKNQSPFDNIIEKLMVEREKRTIPAVYFESWFKNSWSGNDVCDLYRSIPDLSLEEQKLIWTFFGCENPGTERSYFSDDITEMRSRIDGIIQSSERPIKILDLGCGPKGVMLSEIKAYYKEKIELAAGIDIIIDEETQGKLQGNIELYECLGNNMPFKPNYFDIVYSSFSLYFFDERGYSKGLLAPILSEVLRVTNKHFLVSGGTRFVQEDLEKRNVRFEVYQDKTQTIVAEKSSE